MDPNKIQGNEDGQDIDSRDDVSGNIIIKNNRTSRR